MKNVLVTGADGQLGQAIRNKASRYPAFNFLFTDIDTLDITNREKVDAFFAQNRIQVIINTAAYTAVDKAEEETGKAYLLNAESLRYLGNAAALHRCRFIHISTDYVFAGNKFIPYVETDGTHPFSAYGRTKLAGEVILQETYPNALILRTSWLYSEHGNNFLKTMLRLGKEKEEIGVVFDQVGTPTYAGDLADAVFSILERDNKGDFVPGIFHYSNEGVCSWYDFARKIMETAGLRCNVLPIETSDYAQKAKRPHYSVLNKRKIKQTYNISIPHWEDSLKKVMNTGIV